ncbi:MAG TPA: formate dehydrogenase accessory protein FdhE [Chloroflexota bacterium]
MATIARLDELAQADPEIAPYARLLNIAIEAAAQDWPLQLPDAEDHLAHGEPALHGARLVLPRERLEALHERLRNSRALDLQQLTSAVRLRDSDTIAQLTIMPVLHGVRRGCAPGVWISGICPVCAAWPALAESRGLDRSRFLRCGRCGSEWQLPWQLCPFCANADHASLGYLYAEETGESRRVFTCEHCHGYLKTLATLGPIDPLAVAIEDLDSLELDLAALDASFERPTEPGFELQLELAWS